MCLYSSLSLASPDKVMQVVKFRFQLQDERQSPFISSVTTLQPSSEAAVMPARLTGILLKLLQEKFVNW